MKRHSPPHCERHLYTKTQEQGHIDTASHKLRNKLYVPLGYQTMWYVYCLPSSFSLPIPALQLSVLLSPSSFSPSEPFPDHQELSKAAIIVYEI